MAKPTPAVYVVSFATVLALNVAQAPAQTTDSIFRSWSWNEGITAPRAFGLSGAVTGLADDGAAAVLNPGGLATIPRAGEFQLGVRFRSDSPLPNGDSLHYDTRVASPVTLVLRIAPRVGLSYYLVDPRLSSRIVYSEGHATGNLQTSINGPGVGAGFRVNHFLNVGVGLSYLRLKVDEGTYERIDGAGDPNLRVRFYTAGNWRPRFTLGALATNKAGDAAYGLVYRFGGSWRGARTAIDPTTRTVVDEGTSFEIEAPSVLSAGASWQPRLWRGQRFLLSFQGDRIFLGDVSPSAPLDRPQTASDYRMSSTFEWRAGGEFTFPVFGRLSMRVPGMFNRIQLRAGWHYAPAETLVYHGSDPVEQATFQQGDGRNLWTVGMSIGASTIWRLSAAYQFGDQHQTIVGLSLRYPGLFP